MPRLLKSRPETDAGELSPFAFGDLAQQSLSQLERSRDEAAAILDEARQQAEQIRRAAEDEGRAAATAAAEQASSQRIRDELESLLPALRAAASEVEAARAAWLKHWEQSAIRVATAIAARVIRREVAHAPEITLDLVREALELAAGSSEVQLRMHPDDAAHLGPHVEQLLSEIQRLGRVSLVADAAIRRGGCRVDTAHGSIDQQFEAQLDRIAQELT